MRQVWRGALQLACGKRGATPHDKPTGPSEKGRLRGDLQTIRAQAEMLRRLPARGACTRVDVTRRVEGLRRYAPSLFLYTPTGSASTRALKTCAARLGSPSCRWWPRPLAHGRQRLWQSSAASRRLPPPRPVATHETSCRRSSKEPRCASGGRTPARNCAGPATKRGTTAGPCMRPGLWLPRRPPEAPLLLCFLSPRLDFIRPAPV